MDQDLRDLERAALAGDRSALARFLLALVRLEKLEDAWRAARERNDSVLADQIFELGQAPFTLEVVLWPHPNAVETPKVRLLGLPGGEVRGAYLGRDSSVELLLPSPWLGRRSCAVIHAGGSRFVLQDLGSANGVWVDEHRITSTIELKDRSRFSPASPEIGIELRLGWDDVRWPAPPGTHVDRLLERFASSDRILPPHV